MATEVVKVVDPDNGTGTDYTSLNAWEAGEQEDLPTTDKIAIAKCRCTGGSADTTAVVIDGWTTDETRYIKIWTDPSENYRHNGKWNNNKYRLVVAKRYYAPLEVKEDFVRIEGLQIEQEGVYSDGGYGLNASGVGNNSDIRVSYSIIRCTGGTGGNGIGINTKYSIKIWNNIVYDFHRGIKGKVDTAGVTVLIYNNTIIDSEFQGINFSGYPDDEATFKLKNNLVQGSNTNYSLDLGSNVTTEYVDNLSEDNTSPNTEHRNKTVTFVDEANDDFHLASSDSNAKDQGTDLSSDPNLAFSDDIDGETRPGGTAWDIGADEYVAAGEAIIKIMDETVSVSEALIRRLYATRFIGETVAITETMPRRGYSNRLIDETVSISEGILRRLRSNRIINETVSIAETLSRRAFSTRVINETISITEAVLRRLRAIRIISETLSISESLVRRLQSVRVINETVGITESFVRSCVSTIVKIMSETVSVTETLVRRLYSKRIMDETLSISEGILRRLRSVRTMAENISISEVLNRRAFLIKIINETVSVTETFVRSCIAGIVKIMDETVSITESLVRRCTSNRVMQETLSILEILNRKCKMSKIMAETMSIAETIARRCRATRILNETISITETIARSCVATLVKIMNEVVSITESLVKITTLVKLAVGKISFQAHRASVSFKKFMAKISFLRKGD